MAPANEKVYIVEDILAFRLATIINDPRDLSYDKTLKKEISLVQYHVKWENWDESWNSWEPKIHFEPWTTEYDMIVNKLLAEDADLVHPNILEEQAAAWNDEERKSIIRKKEEKALAKVKAKANTKGKQVVKKQSTTTITRRNDSEQPSIATTSTSMNKQIGRSTQNSAVSNYKLEEFALNKPEQLTPSLKDLLPDKPPRRDSNGNLVSSSQSVEGRSRTTSPVVKRKEGNSNKKRIRSESEEDDSFADELPLKPVSKKNKGKNRAIVEDSEEEEEVDEDEGFADDDPAVEVKVDKGKGRQKSVSEEVEDEDEGFADGDDDDVIFPLPLPVPLPQEIIQPAKLVETEIVVVEEGDEPRNNNNNNDDDNDSEGFADEGEGDPTIIARNKLKKLLPYTPLLPSASASASILPTTLSNLQISPPREVTSVDSDEGFADEMDTRKEVVASKDTVGKDDEGEELSEGFADDDEAALKNPRISPAIKKFTLPKPPPPAPPPRPKSLSTTSASSSTTTPRYPAPAPPPKPVARVAPPPPPPPPRPASKPLAPRPVPPPPAPPTRPKLVERSRPVLGSSTSTTSQTKIQPQSEEDEDAGFADGDSDDEISSGFADDDIEEDKSVASNNKVEPPRITTDQLSKLNSLKIPRTNATTSSPTSSTSNLIVTPTLPISPLRIAPGRPIATSRLPPPNSNSIAPRRLVPPPPPPPPPRPVSYNSTSSISTANVNLLPAVPPRFTSNFSTSPRPTPPPPPPPPAPSASSSTSAVASTSQRIHSSRPRPIDPFNNGVERKETKDGYIILKDDVLYQKFRQTDLARKISSAHRNVNGTEEEIVINTIGKIKSHWKIGNPALNFFNFDKVMGSRTLYAKECWIYAPLKDSKELSKKKKVSDDYVALQLLLASMNDGAGRDSEIRQTENLRGATRAIFIHATEKAKIGKEGDLEELEEFRNKKGIIFVIFGGDDPEGMFLQFWNPLGTLAITPQSFVDDPIMMKGFVENGRDSVRNFHHRDVFPWAPLNYLTKMGRFGASYGDEWIKKKASSDFQGIKAFHESIVSDSLCLVHPFRETGYNDKRYFPGPHDMEEYSTTAFTELEGYENIIGAPKGTDIEFLQRQVLRLKPGYLHIRRWIILGTAEEIQSANEYPGVELMNAEEVGEWLSLGSDDL